MQQIVNFIIKYKYFLFFLLLEIIAISLTIRSHSYHHSKFVNSANAVTGSIYKKLNAVKEYSHLKDYNQQLLEENTHLKNTLSLQLKDSIVKISTIIDSSNYFQKYSYIAAKVIHNQYNRKYNYLTINKGSNDSIKPDQGVINSKGIIGIINSTSKKYATVLSILNANSKINVKLLGSDYFGTLAWNGKDYNILQLIDLPVQATIKIGDTIVTGGKSTIFPEGIPVGTILNFEKESKSYKNVKVKLFNDMSAIGPVNIVINFDREEILKLEESISHEWYF